MYLPAAYNFNSSKLNIAIVLGVQILICVSFTNCIIVHTKLGPVLSQEYKAQSTVIYVFKNVPYAKQPVRELRFKLPLESEAWKSENDLNNLQPVYCPQVSSNYIKSSSSGVVGQEDCLFLDIYHRKEKSEESLPVLIYFHPGRFSYGSKEEYRADFLLKYNDMIVVIPNYRLGILGFLSNQDSSLPGNLGLWDQRMAMKWVHQNIERFGGDPQRITIAGHDAGGASVGFHILSPLSHNYFNAAISGSGTALDPWAVSHLPQNAVIVATSLRCPTNYTDNMISCLKMSQLNDILEVQMKLDKVMFRPTIDKEAEFPFLPYPPQSLYKSGYQKNVSYVAGVTQTEAFAEVSSEFPFAVKTQHLDKIIHHLLQPYLQDTSYFPLIVKAAKYHYLRGVHVPTFESIQPQMVQMMSDFLYNSPLQTTLKWHSKMSSNTFMYVLNYKAEDSNSTETLSFEEETKILDDFHTGDASYVFNITFFNESTTHNPVVNHVKKLLCNIWGNFIKESSPSVPNWKKFSEKHKNYVDISTTISANLNYRKNDMEFWTLLVPDLENIKNISISTEANKEFYEDKDTLSWGVAGLVIILGVLSTALVGVVVITRRKITQASLLPITSYREEIQYAGIE